MRNSIVPVLGVVALAALAGAASATAAPIPEYEAVYRAVDEAVQGRADISVSYDSSADQYTLSFKILNGDAPERAGTLRFDLVGERVRPLSYREQSRGCGSCTFTYKFDWDAGRFSSDSGGFQRVASLAERNGSPSPVVREALLMVAMLPGRRELAGVGSALATKSLRTVDLATALGVVQAEGRVLPARDATFWLAAELGHLPVRLHMFSGRSFMLVQLEELRGIELTAMRQILPAGTAVPAALPTPQTAPGSMPEYRAVYRVDDKKVDAGRVETAVRRDAASGHYELTVRAIENKRLERALLLKMPFRLVGERVQPLRLEMEEGGRQPRTMSIDFDWLLHVAVLQIDGQRLASPLTAHGDGDEQFLRRSLLEPTAGLLAFLPGHRELAGFDQVLSSQSAGEAEVSLPIGSVPIERFVLLGTDKDTSLEVWRARELAGMPVRIIGPVMARKPTTMELIEVDGLERTTATTTPQ